MVWSDEVKDVILVELKVVDESNFSDQVVRKKARESRVYTRGHTLPTLLSFDPHNIIHQLSRALRHIRSCKRRAQRWKLV